jgi:hypothetical protein
MRHAIWQIGVNPEPLIVSTLTNEQRLENMILRPEILSDEWMLIGPPG